MLAGMSDYDIDAAARALFDQNRQGQTGTLLAPPLYPPDLASAYRVQDRLQGLFTAAGAGSVAGWKVALTTPVMQQLVGVDHPCEGGIFETRMHLSPCALPHDAFVNVGVESEIAVRLSDDMNADNAPYTRDSVRDAVAACMAAIEIVDDRAYEYGGLEAVTLIADNAFNAGCVLGREIADWRELDLAALGGRMMLNGTVLAEGRGADVLGHPFEALAWLANSLIARGKMLRMGDRVLLGSVVKTYWPKRGDSIATDIDVLGTAEVRFT